MRRRLASRSWGTEDTASAGRVQTSSWSLETSTPATEQGFIVDPFLVNSSSCVARLMRLSGLHEKSRERSGYLRSCKTRVPHDLHRDRLGGCCAAAPQALSLGLIGNQHLKQDTRSRRLGGTSIGAAVSGGRESLAGSAVPSGQVSFGQRLPTPWLPCWQSPDHW